MITYTEYTSGAVMCCSRHDNGLVVVVNRDYDVSPLVRADRARQEVERILMMTATDNVIESVSNSADVVV